MVDFSQLRLDMKKWVHFYRPYFDSEADALSFVRRCEEFDGSAKVIMHQAQRLVTLSEGVPLLRASASGLHVLFLIVCAENVAKFAAGFDEEGESRAFVRRFFSEFLDPDQQRAFVAGFRSLNLEVFSLRQIVDALYKVRCDVVHEGRYWGFAFSDDGTPTTTPGIDFAVCLSVEEFREFVVRGCIRAAESKLVSA
jgi:hypothetical protein